MRFDAKARPIPPSRANDWARAWGPLILGLGMLALAGLALTWVAPIPLSLPVSASIPAAPPTTPPPMSIQWPGTSGSPGPQLLILITHTPIPTIPVPTRSPTPDVQYQMPFCGMGSRINEECVWPALTPTPDPGPPDCLTPAPKEVCRWRGERRPAATPS